MSKIPLLSLTLVLLHSAALLGCAESTQSDPPAKVANGGALAGDPGTEQIAIRTVAEHAGIAESEVTVTGIEAVNFRDASLDCPSPGMSYAQVITPGYRVQLVAGGQQYDVRIAGTRGRICANSKSKSAPAAADTR